MRKLIYWVPIVTGLALLLSAGSGCTARAKASHHLKAADRFFDAGQYRLAELEYENVLRDDPQNVRAWDRRAVIYFNEGRGPEAGQVLLAAQQFDPTNLDIRLKLAAVYLSLGQLKQACDDADFVLSHNPQDDQAILFLANSSPTNRFQALRLRFQQIQQKGDRASLETALGTLALRQNDFTVAVGHFQRAIALNPEFSDAYTGLGGLFFMKKDLKEADHALQTAADLAPPWSGNGVRYAQFKNMTGDTPAAEHLLQDIVHKTPFYLPAWTALAQLSAAQNDDSNALVLLGNVFDFDPQSFEGLLLQGRIELLQGRPDRAAEVYRRMARIYPQAPVVQFVLAQAYLANNQTNEADSSLTQALELNPNYSDAILLRAESEIAHKNPALAIVTLRHLVQQQPRLPQAWLLMADAYDAQGQPDSAIDIYHSLEKSWPDNIQAPVLLGVLLFRQDQPEAARAEFEKALQLEPDYLPAVEQLVNLDLAENQYTAALQLVQQLIVRDPGRAMLQLLLGTTLAAQGQTNQAESVLSKAIQLQPNSQAAYLLLAQLFIQTGRDQNALQNLQTALDKDPNDVAAIMLEAEIYNSEGDYRDARDAYEKLLAITPDNAVALNNLACIYSGHLDQLDKAYPLALRARDLAPSDPAIADTLGWILYQKGEYTTALVLLRESAGKLDSVAEIQFHLGMACYADGFELDAKTSFHRALQLNGDFPEKDDCRQRLAILDIDPKHTHADTQGWLEKWTAGHPADPVALARLEAIYESAGLIDKALAADQAILNANPKDVFALASIAQLYSSTDPQKACLFAKSAYDLAPDDPNVTHLYGRLAFETGDYSWALTLLQLSAHAQPSDPDVLFDLGQSFYSMGKVSEAATCAKEALQSGGTFARADEAKRFLAMIALAKNTVQASSALAQADQILKANPGYVPALMVKAAFAKQQSDSATARQTYNQVLKIYPDFAPAKRELALLVGKSRQ
ncbi:MAG TPA: tetratricopeptide repeat protein [Candidatus Sulfotelmatobacter sp.]|nr:tetratricopeptide repeat protein [Candidatus Sulfotelmatobacter sp.]